MLYDPTLSRCAGASAKINAQVIVGKMTASVPSAYEMEGTELGLTLCHPQGPSHAFTIDFDEGLDVMSAAGSLQCLFISVPEGAYAVTFQDETVDMADFIEGLSFR